MARLYVEGWGPEYGSPLEWDEQLAPAEGTVDTSVETSDWKAIACADDGGSPIAFVDGVRRIDARLTIDDSEAGPIPGICGSFAVGTVLWYRDERRSEVVSTRVKRLAILSGGRNERLPTIALDPPYSTEAIADLDPDHLIKHLHTRMRRAEGEMAAEFAGKECFVVADGPLNDLSPQSMVGHIKSHRVTYLPPKLNAVVTSLEAGERTPLFTIAGFQRYSWYLRLARILGGHSWTGIVRCEASGALSLKDVQLMADRTAAILPKAASQPHLDPRAPQNLVPVGALETHLRHLLGDQGLVYRAIRGAVMMEEMRT